MFDKNEFNAMLARKGMTRDSLAKILGIRRETLYKKIKNNGILIQKKSRLCSNISTKKNYGKLFFRAKQVAQCNNLVIA